MIDELEIQKYDQMFGTRSRYFPPDIILVTSSFDDEWVIRVKNKQTKGVCLLHKNKYGRKNKFHVQGNFKSCLLHAYDSIFNHKNPLKYKANIKRNEVNIIG